MRNPPSTPLRQPRQFDLLPCVTEAPTSLALGCARWLELAMVAFLSLQKQRIALPQFRHLAAYEQLGIRAKSTGSRGGVRPHVYGAPAVLHQQPDACGP